MALVNVQEKWSGADHSVETGDGVYTQLKTSRRTFTVLYDGVGDEPYDAVYATGVPLLHDGHPKEADMSVYRKSGAALGPYLFEVQVDYAGRNSPLLEPYDRAWSWAYNNEPIDRDYQGNAIRNPIGDPIIGLTMDVGDPVYIVTRNETVYPKSWARTYQNSVNDANYIGWDAGQCRMLEITSHRVVDKTDYYWRVTYKMQFRSDGWTLRYLAEGMRYWTGSLMPDGSPQLLSGKDSAGQITSQPVKLQANGTLLPDGTPDVWLEAELYTPKNYNLLGLT